jgi:O-antigen ligase
MCAYQQPPLPAFFSQALALAAWSTVLLLMALALRPTLHPNNSRTPRAVAFSPTGLWALLLLVLFAQAATGITPFFVAAPIALNLALALLLSAGLNASFPLAAFDRALLRRWLEALLFGVLIAALFNVLAALLQSFAPNWTDDVWIARAAPPQDRASGNLRQPNQLATLMIWGMLAASYFWRRRPLLWLALALPMLVTLLATGSRTGILSLLLIVAVALLRSRRVRTWRMAGWLVLVVAAVALAWFAEAIFTRNTANAALAQRLALWRDVIAIVLQHPWFGVGWGRLNFAWTLTALPTRASDVFDHAHSLPLHLAAELGLPIVIMVLIALWLMLWRARAALKTHEGATAALMLATVLLHSLFEHPLWFSYFLLPAAFLLAWLVAAAHGASADKRETQVGDAAARKFDLTRVVAAAALIALLSMIYAVREYQKAVDIHRAVGQPAALARAIERAQASALFGHFGDYAAIMLAGDTASPALFARPIQHVLDERLLAAYARMLARSGDIERAAYVVARAREFPPDSAFNNLPSLPASAPKSGVTSLNADDFRHR